MNIPKFPLPSQPEIEIQFHAPTVKDALKYSDINPAEDEATQHNTSTLCKTAKLTTAQTGRFRIAEPRFGGSLLIPGLMPS